MKRKHAAILSSVLSVSLLAGSAVWSVGAAEPESTDPTTYIEITHENTTDADIGPMATYWQFVGDQQIRGRSPGIRSVCVSQAEGHRRL